MRLHIVLIILLFYSFSSKADDIQIVYDLLLKEKVNEPKISLAIIMYETGWLKCQHQKKTCSLKYNNLFGFMYKGRYLKFKNYKECVRYYKYWQVRHWWYYRLHYKKDYYQYLIWIGYCDKMDSYIRDIKR